MGELSLLVIMLVALFSPCLIGQPDATQVNFDTEPRGWVLCVFAPLAAPFLPAWA
jgi:hypothetical protein